MSENPDTRARYHGRMSRLRQALLERILVLDGAMGTMLQAANLSAADFGGPQYEGCNEHLNLTRPDVVAGVQLAYRHAGADLICTNTFGCAPYVLAEYGLAERAHAIALAGACIAREAAGEGFVVGAMGPGTRSITVTRNVTFDDVRAAYALQANALVEGGVDALLLETQQDTLNLKAAALGVRDALAAAGADRPLMVSATIEPMGTMLAGQGVEALYQADDNRPIFVGERTNVIGSRRFKELIVAGQVEEAAEIGRAQVKNTAHVLDVCLANPDRDEAADMDRFMAALTAR